MRNLKLFPKTFIYATGLMLVIALIAHALIYFLMPVFYTNQMRDTIERDTAALVELLATWPEEEYGSGIAAFVAGSDMTVMLSDGEQAWQIFSDTTEAGATDVYVSDINPTAVSTGISISARISQDHLMVDQAFVSPSNTTYWLKTFLALEPIREASGVVLTLFPLTLVICVVVAAVFALVYSRAITTPIRQISSVARRMEQLDEDATCPVTSGDEIGALATDLNHLYGNLLMTIEQLHAEIAKTSQSEQSKVDFLRTASHELKTPVTAVSGMLEGMIHQVGRYRDRDTYLAECKKQIDGLGELLRVILEASNLDMYAQAGQTQPVDVGSLMASVVEPFELIARAKNVNLVYEPAGSFTADLPERLFSQAVSNVVSNAVNYTAPGHQVRIRFQSRTIVIENECIPIDVDILSRLAEPFYRPGFDHNHDSGGNGLGLSITDKVLAACGIPYRFEPMEDGQGMRFAISL